MTSSLHRDQRKVLGVTLSEDFWVRRYRPPTFSSAVVLGLILLSALVTFGRGFDYAFSDAEGTRSLLVLEAIRPMVFWGWALMGGAAALLCSLVFRIQAAVWSSHVYNAALNVCLTISITQACFKYDGGTSEIFLPLATAVWHGVFIFLTNPFTPHEEE